MADRIPPVRALAAWLCLILALALPRASESAAGLPEAPSIGVGLSGVVDWSTEQPFLDVMKTARPWIGHRPGEWGGADYADLRAMGALDPEGWPRAIPKGLVGLSTIVLTFQPAATGARRYRLRFEGEGTITLDGLVSNIVRRPGEIRFDFTPGEGYVVINVTATDPRGTGDHLRAMTLVAEEDVAAFDAGAVFSPDWLALIEGLRSVRFMDWMMTNNSPQIRWSDRPRPEDFTYAATGVPVEVMVALANTAGVDPWFNMPHAADDAYVRAFATYVRDHLDPRRKAYVEYSNEIWNWQFGQTGWARDQAIARWGDGAPDDAWMQFAGLRAAEVARIWDEVFGSEAPRRLVKVISTQTGWMGLEAPLLEAPLYIAEDPARNRPPAEAFDAYGVTGYFGHGLGAEKAPLVRGWLAESAAAAETGAADLTGARRDAYLARHRYDLATTRAAEELTDGRHSGLPDDSLEALLGTLLPYHAGVARAHGLDLVMYEGGTHVVGSGATVDDAGLTDFLIHLNYSPEMGLLYGDLLRGWRAAGGTLFNAFVDVAPPSKWGSWGALRYLGDATPRWDALLRFNGATPAWWEERPPDAFGPAR